MTSAEAASGLTEALAHLAVQWQHPDPSEAMDLAERAFVDTVGVALAAAGDSTVTTLLDGLGADLRGGPSAVWVRDLAGDSRTAALVNGACAHALDFDDVDDQTIAHVSAVLVPAVLALGEEFGSSGQSVLESYWVGLAVSRALAAALDIDSHYQAGWHSTGTIGTVAAAAAGIRLCGLPVGQARHTLGIAGSLAAGSRQSFGTMTKPLHAGVAAANAVLATRLGAGGFTADTSQLEGPLGYLALHDAAPGERRVDPGQMADPHLNVKLHACCYYIHAAADAMIELAGGGLQADDVARVTVTGPPDGFAALIHHRPLTGLQGKFSMEYAMAACLLDHSLGLTAFTDEAVNRPEAQALLERVELEVSVTPPVGPPEWQWGYAVVRVETTDGQRHVIRVDRPRGHASRPIEEADLRAKFDDCLAHGGFERDESLYPALRKLRDVTSLTAVSTLVSGLVRTPGVDRLSAQPVSRGGAG